MQLHTIAEWDHDKAVRIVAGVLPLTIAEAEIEVDTITNHLEKL